MSRTGKIARLPRNIREQLNRRLQDGEPGPELVGWLNGLPEVSQMLAVRFGGRSINEVNLTEWRQGGFLEWERHEQACALVGNVAERAQDLEWEAEGAAIADRLAALLATELTLYAESVLRETADPKERWDRLQSMLREVSRLRREDHRAARVAIEKERWQAEVDRQEEERLEQQRKLAKARMLTPVFAKVEADALAEVLGGDAKATEAAAHVVEQRHDLKPGTLTKSKPPKAKTKPGKRPASAARRRPRNRRRPQRVNKRETVKHAMPQPEADLPPTDEQEEAGTTGSAGEETGMPDAAPPEQTTSGRETADQGELNKIKVN